MNMDWYAEVEEAVQPEVLIVSKLAAREMNGTSRKELTSYEYLNQRTFPAYFQSLNPDLSLVSFPSSMNALYSVIGL